MRSGSLVLKACLWSALYFLSLNCTSHTLYSAGRSSLQPFNIRYFACLTALSNKCNPKATRTWEKIKKNPEFQVMQVLGYVRTSVCLWMSAHNVLPCAIFSKHWKFFQETADENLLSARKLDQRSKDWLQIKAFLLKYKTELQLLDDKIWLPQPKVHVKTNK